MQTADTGLLNITVLHCYGFATCTVEIAGLHLHSKALQLSSQPSARPTRMAQPDPVRSQTAFCAQTAVNC